MNIQRLRNLTTGILHTEMAHIYEDLEFLTGEKGLMTHMLPRVMDAVKPWLRDHVTAPRFWNGEFDTSHTGEFDIAVPTDADRAAMLERFKEMQNPLKEKDVIVVKV